MKVKIRVLQRHINRALKVCSGGVGVSRQKNCALAEAINEHLLPGMFAEVHHVEALIYVEGPFAAGELGPYERACNAAYLACFPLPAEATAMIDAFDAYLDPLSDTATPPAPGSFILDMNEGR